MSPIMAKIFGIFSLPYFDIFWVADSTVADPDGFILLRKQMNIATVINSID